MEPATHLDAARRVADRKAAWLREHFEITPAELTISPPSYVEYVEHAWALYWRTECAAGRGVVVEKTRRAA